MAYVVNGKTFTDNPLMDEISYNCKLILKSIVIKNDALANIKETATSLDTAELYFIQHDNGSISFGIFPFTYEILHEYGYSDINIVDYLADKNAIPESDRESLTKFANEYFASHFEEQNDYYRMLMGLPPYNSGEEYYIYLSESDLPSKYDKQVDLSLPLHKQPADLLNILYSEGKINELRKIYVGSNYSYMLYLGYRSIDLYTARKAAKWDILYMPNVYYLIEDRFMELYSINRETYITHSYQDFFAQTGEYYDQLMILIVLCQTFADMITEVPEWYIRRDIFDIRSCKYFLESNGVEFYNIIPLKYQIRIVKNLNTLIKYKSTTKNIHDIIDVFNISGVSINKYWLYKKRDKDSESGYTLEFISSDINDSYDNYIKDHKYRTNYDDITLYDKYWDSEEDHNDVKNRIINQNFTIQGTKYMSAEYQISMNKYQYQMKYLLGLILDSNLYGGLSDIHIAVPSIDDTSIFNISDLFLFLVILSNSYYRNDLDSDETKIREPKDMSIGPIPTIDEDHYDWKKKYFPELYVKKNGRIEAFNTNLDIGKLKSELKRRHSHYRFGQGDTQDAIPLNDAQYDSRANEWLTELGVNKFITPGSDIRTIDRLIEVYDNNTECYDIICSAIENSTNQDDKKYLEYIYQELFTRSFDTELYSHTTGGETVKYTDLIEVLKSRDFILYELFIKILKENNIETKQEIMRSIMNDTISTLEYYLSGNGLEFLYSFTSTESFGAIIKYIHLMVNFFKSYKVYFLDPYYTLIADNRIENGARPIDSINEYKINANKWDKSFANDAINGININRKLSDIYGTDQTEIVDIYSHYEPDPLLDMDFDGVTAEKGEEETTDVDGGNANDSSVYPYVMINCGSSYPGMIDMHDVNGGEANEFDREYFSINGGEAYDPDYHKTDIMGSQNFNYIIDGGVAGAKEFISSTLHLKVVGKEIQGYINISTSDKFIHILEDGLYISDADFVSSEEFRRVYDDIIHTVSLIDAKSKTIDVEYDDIITNDKAGKLITSLIEYRFYTINYVLDAFDNDYVDNKIKEYVDTLISLLEGDIDTEPLKWIELD